MKKRYVALFLLQTFHSAGQLRYHVRVLIKIVRDVSVQQSFVCSSNVLDGGLFNRRLCVYVCVCVCCRVCVNVNVCVCE